MAEEEKEQCGDFMKISEDTAGKIVREISNMVNQDVNLMDETGLIIASTNPKRIGTYHVGAQKIIAEKLDSLAVYTDKEYNGARMGINMPICLNGDITGVLGISGEWSQIEPYIRLVRRTTEVLLMNSYLQGKDDLAKKEQRRYLHALLFEEKKKLPEDFISKGTLAGLDLSAARRCVCISFQKEGRFSEEVGRLLEEAERQIFQIRGRRGRTPYIVYREPTQLDIFAIAETQEDVLRFIRELAEKMKLPEGIALKAGVDDGQYAGMELRSAKDRAEKSLKAALRGENGDIVFYGTLTAGVFLSEVSDVSKEEYLRRVFGNMDRKEMGRWIALLEIFYGCEGSITKTAERLFIHKNTLQYQLKKLSSLTGYDPRRLSAAGVYQTAIWFFKS